MSRWRIDSFLVYVCSMWDPACFLTHTHVTCFCLSSKLGRYATVSNTVLIYKRSIYNVLFLFACMYDEATERLS